MQNNEWKKGMVINMENRVQNEKSFWDKAAKNYDASLQKDINIAYVISIEKCKRVLTEEKNVVDMACGTGILALGIADGAAHVEGIDISEEMIKRAISKVPEQLQGKVSFQVGDSYHTCFAAEEFDVVLLFNVLHIVKEPENLLKEAFRILKPDGYLVTATDCYNEPVSMKKKIYALVPKIMHKIGIIKYLHSYRKEDIHQLFSENHFHIIQAEKIYDKPVNYYVLAKK